VSAPLDVALDGLPIQPLFLGNQLGTFGEGLGKIATRQIKAQTTG
jgi:hypothetical protein